MDNSTKDVTVIDDGVEVQRTIEDRATATVVVYRLQTLSSTPSVVQLEEAIPPQDSIETLEFHPEHRPNDWTKRDGTLQFAVTVPPKETRMVVLGIEAADETPIGRDEPKISHLDLEADDLQEPEESASLYPGGDGDPPDENRSSVLDRDVERVTDGGDASTDATSDGVLDLADPNADDEDETGDSTSDGVLDLADPNADDEDETGDEAAQPSDIGDDAAVGAAETGTGPSSDDPDDGANIDDAADSTDDAADSTDDAADTDDAAESDDVADTEDSMAESGAADVAADDLGLDDDAARDLGLDDQPDAEPAANTDGEQAVESAATADDESLVGDLLADIRAGTVDEAELDALRAELGVARTDEVRVEHVQSRMSDFEAYADALEEIINSHGTATEFVDSIERSVTDLEDELSVIHEAVSTVETGLETADDEREQLTEEVAALDGTVDGLSDEVAELHDLVETVDERTTTVETELRGEIEALRDERTEEFDRIESELEATREQLEADVESEIDSLREDVESFNELRRTLLDAFGNGLDVTPPEDTAER